MKDSEILKQARKLISKRKEKYICAAIQMSEGGDEQKIELHVWIIKMLEGYASLGGWLWNVQNIPYNQQSYSEDHRIVRLRWLDWMIKECKKAEAKA